MLAPRAASLGLFDRYLFEIIAVLLIYLLGWHQERISPGMPAISLVVLGLCTVVGVAGTHDLFSMDRARVRLLDTLQRAGVPRPEIRGGFEFDTVTQVMAWGYLNDPRIRNPPDAFKPQPAAYADTNPCRNPYQVYAPVMRPGYVLAADPTPCLNPAPFPPATYRTWLPWATRQLYIGILRQSPTATPGGLPPGTPLTSAK